ncbi:MAG: SufE family protein [Bdellovibrionaceae bacterium]|nr:SufE family protein [Pseudobdellovibrionaceae bacterium]
MSTSPLALRERRLSSEFAGLSSWEDRYKRLIEKGKALGDLPDDLKQEKYKVRGCQSQVWLHAHLTDSGQVIFRADSDALIVKGLAAILLDVYSMATPEEILNTPPQFVKDLGFESHLSPSRANGLFAMVKQIMYYAQAFKALGALKR